MAGSIHSGHAVYAKQRSLLPGMSRVQFRAQWRAGPHDGIVTRR